jgi:hypothetical protein
MKAVCKEVATYAFHGRNCIFFGPSGSGKEYLARYYFKEFTEEHQGSGKASFVSVNCAGLSKELSHSALFGHVKGAFTSAVSARRGAFEEAKNGVMFLDEAGDLDQGIQAIMNRALDPEGGEAHRLGSNAKYLTKEITVIAATERPKEDIRPSLLARLGAQVNVPSLRERPEDFLPAIAFFALRSLAKRRDILQVHKAFSPWEEKFDDPVSNPSLQVLAQDLAAVLTPIAEERHWPGNFRSLRITVDTAIIRAEHASGKAAFVREVESYFLKHMETYSGPLGKSGSATPRHVDTMAVPLPKPLPPVDELTEVVRTLFPAMSDAERNRWVRFLSRSEGGFRSREAQEAHPNLTLRSVQSRLREFVQKSVLRRSGGRGDIYSVVHQTPASTRGLELPKQEFLPLPATCDWPAEFLKDREALLNVLTKANGVYLSGELGEVRTACAAALGCELALRRPVYYWDFALHGVSQFLSVLDEELQKRRIVEASVLEPKGDETPSFASALLAGYVSSLFRTTAQPVLILDHVEQVADSQWRQALLTMIRYWHNITFLLVGRKMGNDLQAEVPRAFLEYRLEKPQAGE